MKAGQYIEFKVDSSGHLLGYGNEKVNGFCLDWMLEDLFSRECEFGNIAEAIKHLNYLTV